jgi:hypothetical protein
MTRLLVLAALIISSGVAPQAHADPVWSTSGLRGHVSAYDLDGTLIDRKLCITHHRTGAVEYGGCSARLRDEVKLRKCTRYGAGTHHFYFQYGDSRPVRSSVYCARRP